MEVLKDFVRQPSRMLFLKKLKHYAENGFDRFEGRSSPIRHEWDGVWRVAHSASLFRVIGFYDKGKESFIAMDSFWKRGQSLSKPQRAQIDKVAEIKATSNWRKRKT
jgi:hypothetical protein